MFNELLEVTREFLKKVITSRLFALAVIFTLMFIGLICKLFRMQILDGSSYQESYMQRTEKLVTTPGTRGNIYDRNGNLLAYNQLAYAVAIQDLGDYPKAADRNAMIYRLVTILERRGEKIDGKLEIALDENGQPYFTSTSNAAKKRFLLNFYGISSQQLDDDTGKYPSNITAREAFELKKGSSRQGYKLADMLYTELREYLPKEFEMLLVASPEKWQGDNMEGVVGLNMPIKVYDLLNTMNMMLQAMDRRRRKRKKERPQRDPKELLMARNNMTEEEAHRYLQKCSMDSGNNIVETAEMVLSIMSE